MKRGDSIKVCWQDIIKSYPKEAPKGYSNSAKIAQKTGVSEGAVVHRLKILREEGKIEAVQIRGKNGRPVWYYKD